MTTLLLVPGAGGDGWYWHRVVPLLAQQGHRAIAVTLPAADEAAGLAEYADAIVAAGRDAGSLVLVAQSMGCFSAAMAVRGLEVEEMVLVNAMVPAPGESPGEWWGAVGQPEAARQQAVREGRSEEFDPARDFFHDVPAEVTEEAFRQGEPAQAGRPFGEPWPLDRWPDVPTRGIAGAHDRLFPVEFQQRVARERLGIELDVVPGGHLIALARPDVVASHLMGT